MKTPTRLFPLLGLALVLGACGGSSSPDGKTLADCPEVLTVENSPSGPVSVLHIDRVKDTIDVPLSKLLDDFRLVKLDNREEALSYGSTTCHGNYITVHGGMENLTACLTKTAVIFVTLPHRARPRRISVCIRHPSR